MIAGHRMANFGKLTVEHDKALVGIEDRDRFFDALESRGKDLGGRLPQRARAAPGHYRLPSPSASRPDVRPDGHVLPTVIRRSVSGLSQRLAALAGFLRSEGSRVGGGRVCTGRCRWWAF